MSTCECMDNLSRLVKMAASLAAVQAASQTEVESGRANAGSEYTGTLHAKTKAVQTRLEQGITTLPTHSTVQATLQFLTNCVASQCMLLFISPQPANAQCCRNRKKTVSQITRTDSKGQVSLSLCLLYHTEYSYALTHHVSVAPTSLMFTHSQHQGSA